MAGQIGTAGRNAAVSGKCAKRASAAPAGRSNTAEVAGALLQTSGAGGADFTAAASAVLQWLARTRLQFRVRPRR